ncbi:Erythromycin 3''-O-methyltransferase [bacterium HR29]|nr:Erythromycin 3''-O-methyltransferase [bacterium HR29]
MSEPRRAEWFAANRANWEARVPVHLRSPAYGVESFLAGRLALDPYDVAAVGDIRGKELLHLQCHLGLETLSWARLGARVTGLDFSPGALAAARELASRAGIAADFVEASVLDAPRALGGRTFDVVYASSGTLAWVPSALEWMRVAAACLRSGGLLFLRDTHPVLQAAADDSPPGRLSVVGPYFETTEPLRIVSETSYVGGEGRLEHPTSYQWNHSLGEIVSAALAVGLALERLEELDWCEWPALPWLEQDGDGRWRAPAAGERLPLSFALAARKSTRSGRRPHA